MNEVLRWRPSADPGWQGDKGVQVSECLNERMGRPFVDTRGFLVEPVVPVCASVAQLDRASDFGSEGCRFKSCRMHHSIPSTSTEFPRTNRTPISRLLRFLLQVHPDRFREYLRQLRASTRSYVGRNPAPMTGWLSLNWPMAERMDNYGSVTETGRNLDRANSRGRQGSLANSGYG